VKSRSVRRIAVAGAMAVLALGGAVPASADTSGSATATVNTAVRSLTVSPSTTTFDACFNSAGLNTGGTLAFPNGECIATIAPITITNGAAPAHIDVQGSNTAVPSDNGTPWTLCNVNVSSIPCSGNHLPGQDQFTESTDGITGGTGLSTSPQCDTAFTAAGTCIAAAGEASTERLRFRGPTTSTDNSPRWTTVWTWTAVP
jgi:hypothetical protein